MRKSSPVDKEDRFHKRAMDEDYHVSKRNSDKSDQRHLSRSSRDREEGTHRRSTDRKQACTKAVILTRKNCFAKDLWTRKTVHSTGALLRLKNSIPVGALRTGKSAHTKGALGIRMSVITSGTSPVTTRGLLVMIALKIRNWEGQQ